MFVLKNRWSISHFADEKTDVLKGKVIVQCYLSNKWWKPDINKVYLACLPTPLSYMLLPILP